MKNSVGCCVVAGWLAGKDLKPFAYQEEAWEHIVRGKSGLVNAPTGMGKTFSVFLGCLIRFINENPGHYLSRSRNGLQLIWVTPLRALAKDIGRAMEEVIAELGLQWKVGIRNGDTSTSERQKQKRQMPEGVIITPESMHLLLAQKNYPDVFKTLRTIAVDEWHELIGGKRGVQVELAISRIVGMAASVRPREADSVPLGLWGTLAPIGNLQQAMDVLLAPLQLLGRAAKDPVIVRARLQKRIEVQSVLPDEIEKY